MGERPGIGERPSQLPTRPQDRPNWGDWSGNRDGQWQNRVDNAHNSWSNWQQNKQTQINNFHNNQEQRWNNIQQTGNNWQNNREEMWDYRADRANEVWDNVGDNLYDRFDDRWWGAVGWGYGWGGVYANNPWWWWGTAAIGTAAAFVDAVIPDPVYVDYGTGGAYQTQTIVVNNQPIPAEQSIPPVVEVAATVEQPPPPLPPKEGKKAEWMPLGVYALTQQEKGDPVMFLQLSVSREGQISGAYSNTVSSDNRPVAGMVDKTTQRVAWRIGDNAATIFETSLGNLTLDVSPVAVHFDKAQTQTWLLVRLPEPAPEGQPATIPEISRKPPPVGKASSPTK